MAGGKGHPQDAQVYRYYVQLVLEGLPYQKPKNKQGAGVVGLDLGPSTLAVAPRQGEARLLPLCEELRPDARKKRRLERKLDRQRRANNPHNYDKQGRVKRRGKGLLTWKNSQGYLTTRRRLAHQERKLAAHRKSLHAPGMLIDHLRRTVAKTGGTLHEVPTRTTKLSQYCHGCRTYAKKPLSQRWHQCACGVGPVQRDLYSAFLAAFLDPPDTIPSIAHDEWEGVEMRLRAAMERLIQRGV